MLYFAWPLLLEQGVPSCLPFTMLVTLICVRFAKGRSFQNLRMCLWLKTEGSLMIYDETCLTEQSG